MKRSAKTVIFSMSFLTSASSNSVMSVSCPAMKSCSSLIRFMASSRWWLSTSDCSFWSRSRKISSAMASYTQLFNLLCDRADDVYDGRLPIHVRCLLDEFANIGQIPKFDKLIATIRSREISAAIILQSQSQLKAIYKDSADTIVGNCDTTIFLGGKETTTLKEMSEMLGKETIDLYNTSDTRGTNRSYGINYQKTGKDLMSKDELAVMDGGKCILQVRGVRPFFSDKYDITRHKRYHQLSDYNPKLKFDVEKYMKHRLILKKQEIVEVHEIDLTDEELTE